MAKHSFSTVLYLVSLFESFRLRYSTGRSSPPTTWARTAPSPLSDASVCNKKGRSKLGEWGSSITRSNEWIGVMHVRFITSAQTLERGDVGGVSRGCFERGWSRTGSSTPKPSVPLVSGGDHLSPRQLTDLAQLQADFADVFSPLPGHTDLVQHHIEILPGDLARSRPYRLPEHKKNLVQEELKAMLNLGVIEESHSDWASPIVLVPKTDGSVRFCVDYRKVNGVSKFDAYTMPQCHKCQIIWVTMFNLLVVTHLHRPPRDTSTTTMSLTQTFWHPMGSSMFCRAHWKHLLLHLHPFTQLIRLGWASASWGSSYSS